MLAEEGEIEIEKVERPLTYNNVHKILSNPFYTGKIIGNDGICNVPSISHKALVSEKLFNRVQEFLGKRNTSVHYTKKLDLPMRGCVRCNICNRVYTPYMKKGILYFGARCSRECPNQKKNFSASYLVDGIEKIIQSLYFTKSELAEIETRLRIDLGLRKEQQQVDVGEENERKEKATRENLKYLQDNKLSLLRSGAYSPEDYAKEEEKLNQILSERSEKEEVSEEEILQKFDEVEKSSELLKSLYSDYNSANLEEKEEICRIIFSELFVSQNMLQYKCKMEFKPFENRFLALCDPKGWISELSRQAIANEKIPLDRHGHHVS